MPGRSPGYRPAPQLPPGYRWIAVRPGAAPPPPRRRRPLGPTPRYSVIPRWGLIDPATMGAGAREPAVTPGPSPWALRATLITTLAVLGAAALIHVIRYVLLIVNRSTLLHPLIAEAATWLAVLASVGAIFTVVACAMLLTGWVIARRSAAFGHYGVADPRSVRALRAGCLIPLVNLAWAPVYVIELAAVEEKLSRLRRPITVWWIVWVLSTIVAVFATATSFTQDPQGIANNTVCFVVAYLFAIAAVVTAAKVVFAFERAPVQRLAHRWLAVPAEPGGEPAGEPSKPHESAPESTVSVEAEGQEPAA